jgi:DNA polymerase III delta prime subunit
MQRPRRDEFALRPPFFVREIILLSAVTKQFIDFFALSAVSDGTSTSKNLKSSQESRANECPEFILAPICRTASMDMRAKIEFLKRAIASQQITLHLQTALAAMLFVLGITVVVLSFVNPGLILAETLKTGQTLGGTAVAASGFIPIFFSRRDKIVALRSLLLSYQHRQVGGLSPDAKLDQHFDQYFAMVLGG